MQKLRTKKALVRLNLLRIIRSVVEAADEDGDLIERVGLGEVIRETAKIDPAILVREMASDLLKSSELNASRAAHNGRATGMNGEQNRRPLRRSSSSTMITKTGSSLPPTPVTDRPSLSRAGSFFDPGIDLARSSAAAHARGIHSPKMSTSSPYRPVSRDSNSGGHSASSSISAINWSALNSPAANGFSSNIHAANGISPCINSVVAKSRLPRTSMSGRSGSRLGLAMTGGSGSSQGVERDRPSSRPSTARERPSSSRSATAEKTENLTPGYLGRPLSRLGGQRGSAAAGGAGGGNPGVGPAPRRSRRLTSGEMR